jgi:zinc transport system substrate-binding protein
MPSFNNTPLPKHHPMHYRKKLQAILAALLMLVGLASCGQREETPPLVSVSIEPVKYFADRLSGQGIEVNVMLPSGASHGSYSPTALQLQRLSDSGLYLRIGYLGYERTWINRLGELNPGMAVVNLSDHVELIRGEEIQHGDHVHEGGVDPHVWMSPAVMLDLLPVIRDAMLEAFPDFRETVEENYPVLEAEVEELHLAFSTLSETMAHKRFMIFHPALTYLARDYGLEQVSIEHEGKEPSPASLARLIQDARDFSVPVIFIQEEYDIRNARLISDETGATVVQINPLGYDWPVAMQELVQTFKAHMQ